MAKSILGMGNPLLDILATVEQSVLDEWGVTLNNAIMAEEQHKPLYVKLAESHPVQYIAGGATLNSIRVAQWMLGAEAGKTSFVGSIGTDAFGKQMKEQVAADGVNGVFLELADVPTGTCAVLVKDAERSLIANLSAAEKYDATHFAGEAVTRAVAEASIFYLAGFPLTHDGGKAAVTAVCEHVNAAGAAKHLCMNVSAPFIAMFFKEPLLAAFESADYVFCNETEAFALSEAMAWGIPEGESEKIAAKIAELPSKRPIPRTAIVTQGAEATCVAIAGGKSETFAVAGNPHTLTKEMIVDTNGAGDAFVGGFLSQLALGKDMAACVRAGHYAAGIIIQRAGCTVPATPASF
ncbi:Ribokinase-like protein [Pavlovales sp. CCMP2436]|nr:Ribokinase-like protein [Pavlovales sp. CCMP2436]